MKVTEKVKSIQGKIKFTTYNLSISHDIVINLFLIVDILYAWLNNNGNNMFCTLLNYITIICNREHCRYNSAHKCPFDKITLLQSARLTK